MYIKLLSSLFFLMFLNNSIAALAPVELNAIGVKVWQNECGGKTAGLISWNKGENFISLGIGHNIWYPKNQRDIFDESFPKLIQFMRKAGAPIPKWLDKDNIPPCPWQTQAEFLQAKQKNSLVFQELQQFLVGTIAWQTKYLAYRMETVLPEILELVPSKERQGIKKTLEDLMKTPNGYYALIDYINFKGDGIKEYKKNPTGCSCDCNQVYTCGWGLLQVLRKMQYVAKNLSVNQAYAWTVKATLTCRTLSAPKERRENEKRWLPGWLKRADTYRSL